MMRLAAWMMRRRKAEITVWRHRVPSRSSAISRVVLHKHYLALAFRRLYMLVEAYRR